MAVEALLAHLQGRSLLRAQWVYRSLGCQPSGLHLERCAGEPNPLPYAVMTWVFWPECVITTISSFQNTSTGLPFLFTPVKECSQLFKTSACVALGMLWASGWAVRTSPVRGLTKSSAGRISDRSTCLY